FVGLYYGRTRQWFSLSGNSGHTETCPGSVNSVTGFDHLHKWFICGGEVFRIYAYGKNDGAALDEEDDIVLYYPAGGSYARFPSNGGVGVHACPLGQLPPASDKFDHCLENLIKVTVK
ncbi:hypothetical protein GBAR_LOCUS12465, partial [Geodia barretti]